MAFLRSHKGKNVLVTVPLHINLVSDDILHADWQDTKIILPSGYQSKWEDVLKGTVVNDLFFNNIFQKFPLGY